MGVAAEEDGHPAKRRRTLAPVQVDSDSDGVMDTEVVCPSEGGSEEEGSEGEADPTDVFATKYS